MKILQINSHYDQGGAARIVACIHRRLMAEGQESFAAYGRGPMSREENVQRIDKDWEIYLSALFSRISGLNGWFNRRAAKRLIAFIEKIRPDVIHIHTLHGYYLNFNLLFSYLNRQNIPCVWTFHDCHAFVGNCGYFFECDKWKRGCGHCPHLHNYPDAFMDFTAFMWKRKRELFAAGDNKVIVTPSDWLTETARQSFFGKYACVTVRNGVDAKNTFYPRDKVVCREKHGFMASEKLILGIAAGYSDPRKGVKYILQTAKELKHEARVILIGWEKQNDKMLEGISNMAPLPPVNDLNMLAEYYSMADVFVLPSLAENYATVSLEAMACGTPVVGFDVGGIPEQLAEGKGITVKAGDQQAFTQAVKRVLFEESGLLRGKALAEVIQRENSVEKMTAEYLEIYRKLIGVC